jgi:hypothetical protein
MSLPLEDLSRNSWKYHFDSVLLGFRLLIDIVSNLVQVRKNVISHFLFIKIIIAKCSFLFSPWIILNALGISK